MYRAYINKIAGIKEGAGVTLECVIESEDYRTVYRKAYSELRRIGFGSAHIWRIDNGERCEICEMYNSTLFMITTKEHRIFI